ncbi:aspartate/glutamate racemase family protein [uncultured Propionivibrio sp.]|uniref:aspartate/glutamate racemase family protein n=1 Tax=uncultured Propionivibrio sp. TaxID=426737 RepID=UPI0029C02ADA|nr:aspartate/glutamate racemase family protein [uncultured Propionivibrio sp.]
MKTVAAVYTAQSLIEPTKALFAELIPEHRLVNIFDDSLIADVMRAGHSVTTDVRRRLSAYYRACEDMGADVIFNTCSSMGDIVDQIRPFSRVPILKIDEPMVRQAVGVGTSIAVMMTNPTTLVPTLGLVRSVAAQLQKPIRIIEGMAQGAFEALVDGQPEKHDALLLDAAIKVASEADAIILAQGSMARMQEAIVAATGRPVFSSPRLGVMAIRDFLNVS